MRCSLRATTAWFAALILAWTVATARAAELPPTRKDSAAIVSNPAPAPATQETSLAMMVQVVKQLERYVGTKDLDSIHNEDTILNAALNGLLANAATLVTNRVEDFKTDVTTFAQRVTRLHLAADLARQAESELQLSNVLAAFDKVKAHFPGTVLATAERSAGIFTCPMHRDVIGGRTNLCAKCGMELDQMIRVLPPESGVSASGQHLIRATIRTEAPLARGQPATAFLRLQKSNGDPVLLTDLIETHTERIHLLIIDASLTDYHHEHPRLTRTPGEYAFNFTPRKPGSYRAWADLRPHPLGLQQYAVTDIAAPTAGEPLTDRTVGYTATVDGLNFELILGSKEVRAGRPAPAKLRITTADGQVFTQLEPIMATFAHIVGFNEDYKTVLHIHPKGAPVLDPAARGGPELEFQIYTLRPGFYRLFGQVQIGGRSRFAPFGLNVVP